MASLVLHWWALVDVIGCNLQNRCDSRTFDRTKLGLCLIRAIVGETAVACTVARAVALLHVCWFTAK